MNERTTNEAMQTSVRVRPASAPARPVHPAIAREMALLDRAVELAEQAAQAITGGAMAARDCNVLLGAGRMMQGSARQSILSRLSAPRLALQEAKLVEEAAA